MSEYETHNQGGGVKNDDVRGDTNMFSSRTAYVVAGIAIAGIIVWLFFGIRPVDKEGIVIEEVASGIAEISALSRARNTYDALTAADDLLQRAREAGAPPFVEAHIQAQQALNLFRTNDIENQKDAIRIMKGIANDERLSRERRASGANRLLSFYYTARAPHVSKEIFIGEPFESFGEGVEREAVRDLAEYSISLFPTSFAALRAANWYDGELLDNKDLSDETNQEYRDKIKIAVSQAKALFENERASTTSKNRGGPTLHNHWIGFHLGVLTANNPEDPQPFEEAFQFALDQYVQGDIDSNVVATTVVYTYFYYAAFLHEVFGDERITDQRVLLQTLVDMVHANPTLYESGIIAFMNVERDRLPETRDHNYRWFIELAEISPEFKGFLEENGWEL